MTPLRRLDDRHIALLPPQYMAATGYYAVMAAYGHAVIDTAMTANKRFKSAHRCDIIDTQGPLFPSTISPAAVHGTKQPCLPTDAGGTSIVYHSNQPTDAHPSLNSTTTGSNRCCQNRAQPS